jgi:hypothetical protein
MHALVPLAGMGDPPAINALQHIATLFQKSPSAEAGTSMVSIGAGLPPVPQKLVASGRICRHGRATARPPGSPWEQPCKGGERIKTAQAPDHLNRRVGSVLRGVYGGGGQHVAGPNHRPAWPSIHYRRSVQRVRRGYLARV